MTAPAPAALAALHAACFTMPRPWEAGEIAALLADDHVFLCSAPAAFLLGRVILDEAEVLTLAVHPDHRRQGHARSLLDQFHARARARGAARAFLEVAAGNAPARGLYAAAGYLPVGRRPGYYHGADGRDDALILQRGLTAA